MRKEITFDHSFYEDFDEIIVYSRLFYRGDNTTVLRFVDELLREIETKVSNAFMSGIIDTINNRKIRSILIRKTFRVYFIEDREERRIIYLRAAKTIR